MKLSAIKKSQSGFSMIEVLISVVVLGFGLLALAALQTSIIRASADSKAQSIALQLAKEKIEDLRAFRTLTQYQGIDTGTDITATSIGGVSFNRAWSVSRWAYRDDTNVFESVTPVTGATPAGGTPSIYTTNNEYKLIAVTVSWTDANGATQSVGLEDAIGAISPADGAKVVLNNTSTSEPRYPRVLIYDPSNTAGVIPVAIGDGTDTAATNPKPEVASFKGKDIVTETRFDVLTYAGLNNGSALAQSRVETVVIGCTCNASNAVSTDTAYRPTYWNGFRYAIPSKADYAPLSAAATLSNSDRPQSQYCNTCCRDHHDPSTLASGKPKFDPRRSTHGHYKIDSGSLVLAGATDNYTEACRLIRVEGIFRVASDLYNDYYNLLEARNDGSAAPYAPSTTATTNYQNMVLGYLDARIVNQGSTGAYNTLVGSTAVAALESTHSINSPATISVAQSDKKWLHGRGLFIDYLESEAVDKITDAKLNCKSPYTTQSCVLKYVPFTSINLSELSNWTPESGTEIVMTNSDFSGYIENGTPVRGLANIGSSATKGSTQQAFGSIYSSNSGVALLSDMIDTDETEVSDSQDFVISGNSGGGGKVAGTYSINFDSLFLTGLSTSSYPSLSASPSAICNYTSKGSTKPNPFTCSTEDIGGAVSLIVGKYNYQDSSRTSTASITCSGPDGNKVYLGPYNVNYCINYAVKTVDLSGVISESTNDGVLDETTTIYFGAINDGNVINIEMIKESETQTTNTCTYTCSKSSCTASGNKITYTVARAECD